MKNNKLYNQIINSIAKLVKHTLNESIDFDDIDNDDEDIINDNIILTQKEEMMQTILDKLDRNDLEFSDSEKLIK